MRTIVLLALTFFLSCSALAQENDAFLKSVASHDVAAVRTALEKDPALVNAHKPDGTPAVLLALIGRGKEETTFQGPTPANETLQLLLARKPHFDVFTTAALGTADDLETMLKNDPSALQRMTYFGWTLLHTSAFAGNVAATEILIRKGADVNVRAKNKFRNTPLQTALLSGQYATAKLLLDHGADALIRQAGGEAPMHSAAELGRIDIIQLLIDHGAEVTSKMDDGRTPLSIAVENHRDEAAAFLKEKGAKP